MKKNLFYGAGLLLLLGIFLGSFLFQTKNEILESPDTQQEAISQDTSPTSSSSGEVKESNPNPDLSVDSEGLSKAVWNLKTTKGLIRAKFYTNDAPETVRRMVELTQQKFYNGLTFHRVVPNFVAQGGDPTGTGMGGSGKKLKAEFNQRKHERGTLAMARAQDPDSADSQFYLTLSTQAHLDGQYTVFGKVIEGEPILDQIEVGDQMINVWVE